MRTDVYQKITDQIVTALEQGVRPWHQPWNVEHSAGRITRPLRGNAWGRGSMKRVWKIGENISRTN